MLGLLIVVASVVLTSLQGYNRSEEHTSELQSHHDLVCRLLLEKKKKKENELMVTGGKGGGKG